MWRGNLKVFVNRKTGQQFLILPKKEINLKDVKFVKVKLNEMGVKKRW
jgi:hypothetical protein